MHETPAHRMRTIASSCALHAPSLRHACVPTHASAMRISCTCVKHLVLRLRTIYARRTDFVHNTVTRARVTSSLQMVATHHCVHCTRSAELNWGPAFITSMSGDEAHQRVQTSTSALCNRVLTQSHASHSATTHCVFITQKAHLIPTQVRLRPRRDRWMIGRAQLIARNFNAGATPSRTSRRDRQTSIPFSPLPVPAQRRLVRASLISWISATV